MGLAGERFRRAYVRKIPNIALVIMLVGKAILFLQLED